MMEFTMKHKYCDCVRVIEGFDIYDACKKAGLDLTKWVQMQGVVESDGGN